MVARLNLFISFLGRELVFVETEYSFLRLKFPEAQHLRT